MASIANAFAGGRVSNRLFPIHPCRLACRLDSDEADESELIVHDWSSTASQPKDTEKDAAAQGTCSTGSDTSMSGAAPQAGTSSQHEHEHQQRQQERRLAAEEELHEHHRREQQPREEEQAVGDDVDPDAVFGNFFRQLGRLLMQRCVLHKVCTLLNVVCALLTSILLNKRPYLQGSLCMTSSVG